jgi:phage head maturation protease
MRTEGRAVDTSPFNGGAAYKACSSASDYASVCAGRRAGDPSLRSTWALPHHQSPGSPPNKAGVDNALSRLPQTQGLINKAAAKKHLDNHKAQWASPRSLEAKDMTEVRALPTENLFRAFYPGGEVRDVQDGPPILSIPFAPFFEWTEIESEREGHFMERWTPEAFESSFAAITPKAVFQHGRDPEMGDKLLGSPVSLRDGGYEVPLFSSVPPLLLDGLKAGAYGSSFRFHVPPGGDEITWRPSRSTFNPEGLPERVVAGGRVREVGPVTFPAYTGATAGIRSLTDEFRPHDLDSEIAQMVREHPKDLAARIQKALTEIAGDEEKPLEDTPPTPARFRSREEFLQWISPS